MKSKKLAIFVEGQTEQLFLKEFIEQVAGAGNIEFVCQSSRKYVVLSQKKELEDEVHRVLIVDCQGDEAVKSTVLDQRDSLVRAGYSLILGLRDLYPNSLDELKVIKRRMKYGVPTAGVPTHILLAVAEIEAWFLQEHNHFPRVDQALNVADFKNLFGFDPLLDDAERVDEPAALLHKIYSSVGKAYKKKRRHVQRTIELLDYENLYFHCPAKMPHLAEFLAHVENFLAPDFSIG